MSLALALLALAVRSPFGDNLLKNPGFDNPDASAKKPQFYELSGAAAYQYGGYSDEFSTPGISLRSTGETGSVSQLVAGIDQDKGKWVRFTFRGMPEPGFKVDKDALFMEMEFFSKGGKVQMDKARRLIYREILQDRSQLESNGNDGKEGSAAWRTYEFEELLPFAEVDTVKISVAFEHGASKKGDRATFFVDDFSLTQSARSMRGLTEPGDTHPIAASQDRTGLVPAGGRWFYRPGAGEKMPITDGKWSGKLVVSYQNADRLFYDDGTLGNPFASNMTAWMRKGYMDANGKILTEDRFVPDNLVIEFDGSPHMTLYAKNIPNHQTAKFPDTYGTQGYNPSYIQEHHYVYQLPLNPKPNKDAVSMTTNRNGALPMGAIGVAVNGVVFYNPFDAGMQDASSIMDRCCGHPSPDYRYHYHKYPICVNTPFVDKGETHSPLIGFAFDGFPVYGPYESKGMMAKDLTANKLNNFNGHFDKERGWHYHVTPGKFPYIIGGYWGSVDMRRPR